MFNALKYTEELEKAGFTQEQAKVSLRLIIDVMNEEFAKKSDLKELELRMDSRFQNLEAKMDMRFAQMDSKFESRFQVMDSRIDQLENRLTIKLGGMMVVTVGLAVTLMKLI